MSLSPRKSLRRRTALLAGEAAPSRLPVVCDVGALKVERPPYAPLVAAGAARVVGFEPQKEAYDALVAAAGENETYINAALGKPGKATLNVYRSQGYTSLFRLDARVLRWIGRREKLAEPVEQVPLELRALDDVDEVPPIDLLKIDVQGAEHQIIASGRAKLARAMAIIVEVPFLNIYADAPRWCDLDAEIRDQGFVLHKLLPYRARMLRNSQSGRLDANHAANQMTDGDAIYIRRMDDAETLSDDQLKCQALFAATVFDSQDLAVQCLDVLAARGVVPKRLARDYVDLLPDVYKVGEAVEA